MWSVLFVACLPAPDQLVDRATLLRDPAASLRLPGVTELAHVGDERRTTVDGPQPAFDGYLLGTQASDGEVFSYYDAELRRLGWLSDRLVAIPSTVEFRAWGWCKAGMNFRLGIEDPKKAFTPEFLGGRSFTTVFDARISSRGALACPYQPTPFPSRSG